MPPVSSTPTVQPVGQYVTVALLPDDPKSSILEVVSKFDDMTRKGVVQAVGHGVPDLAPGQTVLCRPLQGHYIGDLLLLPQGAILATCDA